MAKLGGIQPNEHIPTSTGRAKVEALCCVGLTQDQIANYMQIDTDTLCKHYANELRTAKNDKLCDIAALAYTRAREGNDKMTELILRTQARWSNPQPIIQVVAASKSELEQHVKDRGLALDVPRGTDADVI